LAILASWRKFANSGYFEDIDLTLAIIRPDPRYIVLDAEGINQIDSAGEERLRALAERLHQSGVIMPVARMKQQFT